MTDEQIKEIAEKWHDKTCDGHEKIVHDYTAVDDIESAIRVALASQWISVKDGLPKEKVRYLVASNFWGFVEAELWNKQWYTGKDEESDFHVNDVTHYMEIPQLPDIKALDK